MRKITFGLAIACLIALGGAAHAAFSVFAESQGQIVQDASFGHMPVTWDDNMFANSFPDAAAVQHAAGDGGTGGGSASSHVTATFGAISADGAASDIDDPDVYPQASASGLADAAIEDAVHVHSATLAAGTPVQLDVALHLTSNASSPAEGTDYFGSARATLDLSGQSDGVHLEYLNVENPVSTLSGTVDSQVGETLDLSYAAYAHAFVAAAATDASGTFAGITIQPRITAHGSPDVTFTTDSGFDYGLPVPEPSCEEAGALALIGLACAKRSGASRRSAIR